MRDKFHEHKTFPQRKWYFGHCLFELLNSFSSQSSAIHQISSLCPARCGSGAPAAHLGGGEGKAGAGITHRPQLKAWSCFPYRIPEAEFYWVNLRILYSPKINFGLCVSAPESPRKKPGVSHPSSWAPGGGRGRKSHNLRLLPSFGWGKKTPQRTTEKFPRGYREGENKDSLVGPATIAQQLLGFHWDPGTSLKATLEWHPDVISSK